MLGLGCVLRVIKVKTGFPYTPMLMILGVFLGGYYPHFGDFGNACELMLHIDPHGI